MRLLVAPTIRHRAEGVECTDGHEVVRDGRAETLWWGEEGGPMIRMATVQLHSAVSQIGIAWPGTFGLVGALLVVAARGGPIEFPTERPERACYPRPSEGAVVDVTPPSFCW